MSSEREQRLRALFDEYADQVLRYAMRRVDRASAHDVVSDTFLVAWRRIDDVPQPALPWLYVVAGHCIANRLRTLSRQQRLAGELAALERAAATAAGADELVSERAEMLARLARLTPEQRDALLLVVWDGLTAAEAAQVVGCTRAAFEVRLHRARKRLREPTADDDPHATRASGFQEVRP